MGGRNGETKRLRDRVAQRFARNHRIAGWLLSLLERLAGSQAELRSRLRGLSSRFRREEKR